MAKIEKGGLGMTEFKKYKHKESGEECSLMMESGEFVKIFFPDNQGEENGDYDQVRILNKQKFLEQYEPIN